MNNPCQRLKNLPWTQKGRTEVSANDGCSTEGKMQHFTLFGIFTPRRPNNRKSHRCVIQTHTQFTNLKEKDFAAIESSLLLRKANRMCKQHE